MNVNKLYVYLVSLIHEKCKRTDVVSENMFVLTFTFICLETLKVCKLYMYNASWGA